MTMYLAYALGLFKEGETDEDQKAQTSVTLKGMGRAIAKTVGVAEIIKHRICDLHQTTTCYSSELRDGKVIWIPICIFF